MKLLRTIRLDRSDTFVFARAAETGEWATPGGFMFWEEDPARLEGKARAAFRSGFLGLTSFGWSTLAEVAAATAADRYGAVERLALLLVDRLGAPSPEAARAAAEEEIAFAASLCDHPVGTIVALQRTVEGDGEVRERFRTLKPTLEPEGNSFAQGCVLPIGIAREDAAADAPGIEEPDLVGMLAGRDLREPGKERP